VTIRRGSRYEGCAGFTPAPGVPAGLLRPRSMRPAPGVVEHTLATGERADLLARHYYNDSARWWLILEANPELLYAGDLDAPDASGYVIQVPAAR
jgi:hypothetical protein